MYWSGPVSVLHRQNIGWCSLVSEILWLDPSSASLAVELTASSCSHCVMLSCIGRWCCRTWMALYWTSANSCLDFLHCITTPNHYQDHLSICYQRNQYKVHINNKTNYPLASSHTLEFKNVLSIIVNIKCRRFNKFRPFYKQYFTLCSLDQNEWVTAVQSNRT